VPTYITLIRFTQKGVEAIREGPARLDAAKQAYAAVGAKLKAFYLVTGRFDAVAIGEAPDDETMAKLSLAIASKGNSRTETVRAFAEDEYRKIVKGLPELKIK
jgi:uncharacterized protein with GYD domain